jgi:hypothetical protein
MRAAMALKTPPQRLPPVRLGEVCTLLPGEVTILLPGPAPRGPFRGWLR